MFLRISFTQLKIVSICSTASLKWHFTDCYTLHNGKVTEKSDVVVIILKINPLVVIHFCNCKALDDVSVSTFHCTSSSSNVATIGLYISEKLNMSS
jgi:hypothetical protein